MKNILKVSFVVFSCALTFFSCQSDKNKMEKNQKGGSSRQMQATPLNMMNKETMDLLMKLEYFIDNDRDKEALSSEQKETIRPILVEWKDAIKGSSSLDDASYIKRIKDELSEDQISFEPPENGKNNERPSSPPPNGGAGGPGGQGGGGQGPSGDSNSSQPPELPGPSQILEMLIEKI